MFRNNSLYSLTSVFSVALLLWASAAFASADADLITTLKRGDTSLAADLLSQGVDLHTRTESGATPLHLAAAFGYPEIVRILLEAGADTGARGPNGNTPLLYAAQEGHAEVVRVLLRAGADPEAENDFGATATGLARGWGHRAVSRELGMTALTDVADSSVGSWPWVAGLLAAAATGAALFRRYTGPGWGRARCRELWKQAA